MAYATQRAQRLRVQRWKAKRSCSQRPRAMEGESLRSVDEIVDGVRKAPISQKEELKQRAAKRVFDLLEEARNKGEVKLWGMEAEEAKQIRDVPAWELKNVGVKNPESIGKQSSEAEFNVLAVVVAVASVLAILTIQLPGTLGFVTSYLTGGSVFAVLAIGGTKPGILKRVADYFGQASSDEYKERVLAHEAGHFLMAHLMGIPVQDYSVSLGHEHTDIVENRMQQGMAMRRLPITDVHVLSVVAMAGIAAEAACFGDIKGQQADLIDLQRILDTSAEKLSNSQQQNLTRWALWKAATLVRKYSQSHEALVNALRDGSSIGECIYVIETANTAS